ELGDPFRGCKGAETVFKKQHDIHDQNGTKKEKENERKQGPRKGRKNKANTNSPEKARKKRHDRR
ncbi:hypothetical protein ACQ1ZG_14950, partial [Enterococcus faecalis]|uniref:hypothetical protein n=1 Tax=Enterococcus faecalis TaxID=1351 RepID=UPI003D6B47A5